MSAADGFRAAFGRPPEVIASAPGRVNLIGEHTDYNGGLVLPAAIPHRAEVALAPREGATVRVGSANQGDEVEEYRAGVEAPRGRWIDYVQATTATLAAAGQRVGGFDAWISSAVPAGSGLASSAALTVALLRALREAFGLPVGDLDLALLAQRGENEFVGARVGIMDPVACTFADERSALFLDTLTLDREPVLLPPSLELAVVDSGIRHGHATGGYNDRREECERAAALLGVVRLRDLTGAEQAAAARLPPPLDRRVRHVLGENERVCAAVAALRAADLPALGRLFAASHASMRDDYEVSVPDVDLLVELAAADPDAFGARLTGGGFGGSVVIAARSGAAASVARRVAAAYERRSGRTATVLVPAEPRSPPAAG